MDYGQEKHRTLNQHILSQQQLIKHKAFSFGFQRTSFKLKEDSFIIAFSSYRQNHQSIFHGVNHHSQHKKNLTSCYHTQLFEKCICLQKVKKNRKNKRTGCIGIACRLPMSLRVCVLLWCPCTDRVDKGGNHALVICQQKPGSASWLFFFFADLSLHHSSKPSEESSSCLHDARRFCCSMLCSSAFTEGWPAFGVCCILTILHRGTLSCECAQSLLNTSYKYGIYFSEHTTIIDHPLLFFLKHKCASASEHKHPFSV